MKHAFTALTLAAAGSLSGCADGTFVPPDPIGRAIFSALNPQPQVVYTPQEYIVTSPMPTVRYETRPAVPSYYRDPVYINGYWGWNRNNWAWVPGHWVNRPRPNAVWVGGQYYTRPNGYYWRSGYWR